MTVKEMLERANIANSEARSLLSKADATAEEKARIPALVAEYKQLMADADTLMTVDREGAVLAELAKGATGGATAKGAKGDEPFATWGEFLKAAHLAKAANRADARLRYFDEDREEKDMSGETGAGGGFLIPTQFLAQLASEVAENSIVRPRARIIQMTSRQVSIPALNQAQTLTAGQPQWFGGLLAHWIGEGELKPASDAAFREITLAAKKLVLFTRASDELLADSAISLESFLSGPMGMAGAIAWYEDYAFLWGSGAAQPLGIMNSPALLSVKRDVSGKVLYSDLVRMMVAHRMSRNSRWVISQSALGDLMYLQDPDGNLIWNNAVAGMPATLMGLPYDVTEKLPVKGTTGDVLLADFGYYTIGDRQATTVESTKFEAWQYDKTSWRAVRRVDGQPSLNAPWTLQDTVTQISPFVVLSSDVS